MRQLFESKYYKDLSYFLEQGWSEEEINTYFPAIEALDESQLLGLLELCGIRMFSSGETVNKEQAIHVLVNLDDTPKDLLIEALQKI